MTSFLRLSISRDDFFDGFAVVYFEAFASGDFEFARIEAELMKDSGMDVGDVVAVFRGVESDFIGGAMDNAAF